MAGREWLRHIRAEKGMTQADLASNCGISQEMIHYLETGKRAPTPKLAQRLGSLLGFDWTRFFYDCDEDTSKVS